MSAHVLLDLLNGLLYANCNDNSADQTAHFDQHLLLFTALTMGERSGSVVECLTRDRGAAGSSLTSVIAWCS